jgi:hypothetical protein
MREGEGTGIFVLLSDGKDVIAIQRTNVRAPFFFPGILIEIQLPYFHLNLARGATR